MGNIQKSSSKQDTSDRILIQGLYNAGKSTILYKLKVVEEHAPMTDFGTFTVENHSFDNLQFMCFDIGGRSLMRPLARCYYPFTKAVVFVVDSAEDGEYHMETIKYELQTTAKEENLSDTVFLILANKQDLPAAMSVEELTEKLELSKLTQEWNIFGCSGSTGEGLYEAFDWLSEKLNTKQKQGENNEMSKANRGKNQENTGNNTKTEGFLVKRIKEFKRGFLTVGKRKN